MVLDENTRLFAVVADKYQAEGNPEVVLKGCEDRIIQLPDLALLTTDDASARNEFPIGAEDRWNMPFSRYEILIRDTFGSELRLAITEMAEETQIIPVILGFSEGNVEAIGRLTDNGKSNTLNSFGYFEERWLLQKDGSHILAICVPHSSLAYSSPLQIHPKPNLYAALSELDIKSATAKGPVVNASSLVLLCLRIWLYTMAEWTRRCEGREVEYRTPSAAPEKKSVSSPLLSGKRRIINLGKHVVVYEGKAGSREFRGYHMLETQRCGYFRTLKNGGVTYVTPTIVHFKKVLPDIGAGITTTLIYRNTEDFLREKSYLEDDMCKALRRHGIRFEREKNFSELGRKRLDFFLPDFNAAIECQGVQHFYRYGANDKDFEQRKQRDADKKRECQELGIRLLYLKNKEIPVPEFAKNETYYVDAETLIAGL